MLQSLSIRDVVLIERLVLRFSAGLCVLTGETGAGKSILLDALGLALGQRAEAGLVRRGASQAVVAAEILLPSGHPARALLSAEGIEAGDSLVLRRIVSAEGRSRVSINDEPASVGLLRRVADTLIEVQGQFDGHGLLDPTTHRALLDDYADASGAGAAAIAATVAATYATWQRSATTEAEARTRLDEARAEETFLRHAHDELDRLAPSVGEETELAARRAWLVNASRIADALSAAHAALDDETGARARLGTAVAALERVADQAGERLSDIVATLDRAIGETDEATRGLQAIAADLEADPGQAEEVEERLFRLRDVARKHGRDSDALVALQAELAARLSALETGTGDLARLAAETATARAAFIEAAQALGRARRAAAARLETAVAAELAPLRMDKTRLEVSIEPLPESAWSPSGTDRIAFLVATNPGAAPAPIARVASGGERSRLLLALKVTLADLGSAATLVFDEVDQGVGGAVAAAVGARLARLGETRQVLVVTHAPQVAARAAQHFLVRKAVDEGGAVSDVTELGKAERHEEIARMLSGATVTDAARAAARSLIDGVPA